MKTASTSTRAAIEEGIVIGGGVALLRASKSIANLNLSREESVGAEIVFKACEAPFRQIVLNVGLDPSVVLNDVLSSAPTFGFNAQSELVEDLLKAGVVDPAKVVKNALKYAASTAGIIILSEALIGNAPEDEEEKA